MSTSPPPILRCPACGTATDREGPCPACQAAGRSEPFDALDFVARRLEEWYNAGQLTDRQLRRIGEMYAARRQGVTERAGAGKAAGLDNLPSGDRCWSCKEPLGGATDYCRDCG